MDDSVPDIEYDDDGVCNYCREFEQRSGAVVSNQISDPGKYNELIARIKGRRKSGQMYDCIVGVSGGVDSSWVLHLAVESGLRPLAVHMDNGWNSELAQNNINNLITALDVDLYTHVINWVEYRRLMQAFFDANVVDVELLYDNAMMAVNYEQAAKHGIHHILAGTNQATEGLKIPRAWNWAKHDKKNIKAIASAHGKVKIDTFPAVGTFRFLYNYFFKGVRWVDFLDLVDYNKEYALDQLESRYGYKRYKYKHYESVFTRFYQGYILPVKFGGDKRRPHLSSLIISGQLSREDALNIMEHPPYEDKVEFQRDKEYFLQKMQWSEAQLDEYLAAPRREHDFYASERWLWEGIGKIHKRWFK